MTEAQKKKMREKAAKLSNPTPRERANGKWRCEVMVNGQRISVTEDDPAVAHAKALAIKEGIIAQQKAANEEKRGNITLKDAIGEYINARTNVLSPSTINGYYEIQRNRFKSIMSKKVSKIDYLDLQKAVNEDAKKVGQKTIKNALGLVLAAMADYGVKISVEKIKLPQRKKKEASFYEEEELIALFDLIRGSFIELPILLATWLGLRRSEIFGLCWDAINFETSEIEIKRSYVKDNEQGYILRDETKTTSSRRTLACPGYILSKLKDYSDIPISKRTGRVFKMHPNTPYQTLKDMCKRSGLKFVGVHGLRHTNASVMVSLGVMDKYIMAEGGWSTSHTMQKVYQHVFASGRKSVAEKRDSFFADISSGVDPTKKKK